MQRIIIYSIILTLLLVLPSCVDPTGNVVLPVFDSIFESDISQKRDIRGNYYDQIEPCLMCQSTLDCPSNKKCHDGCCLDYWCEDSDNGMYPKIPVQIHVCT